MMEGETVPKPADAQKLAVQLVGVRALAAAYKDVRSQRIVEAGTNTYNQIGGGMMPKLLFKTRRVLQGTPKSGESLLEVMKANL